MALGSRKRAMAMLWERRNTRTAPCPCTSEKILAKLIPRKSAGVTHRRQTCWQTWTTLVLDSSGSNYRLTGAWRRASSEAMVSGCAIPEMQLKEGVVVGNLRFVQRQLGGFQ